VHAEKTFSEFFALNANETHLILKHILTSWKFCW